MGSNDVRVQMLGRFSIARGGQIIDDQSNRMRKVWLLLAYLIYNRNSHISQAHFIDLLQGRSGDGPADPAGSLKVMFFRTRGMLDKLDGVSGHDLILRRDGNYTWNTDIPLTLDVEEFESICKQAAATVDKSLRLERYLQALDLYQGDFLPKLSTEAWVMSVSAYYHRLYMETAEDALLLLEEAQRWEDAVHLCLSALKIEPYSEELYQHLMRCQLAAGNRPGAQASYEQMSELLFSTFGVMPSDESRALYREASRSADGQTQSLPAGIMRELLQETDAAKGALFCEYDFFRVLYQAQARALVRSGDTVHVALLSLHGYGKKELPRRSLDRAMENLKELIVSNLRQGDVVTQCSVSQFIVMLPQANYENSCLVCERLVRAFGRQYPHSPAKIHFSVQPMEPMLPAPATN